MDNPQFLALVARDLISRFGRRFADVTVVFPGRRAHLFLNQYLSREAHAPVWAPQYLSIDELFDRLSSCRRADTLRLTGDLYDSYRDVYQKRYNRPLEETLDEFFFFGEILLNDFDDIDKNLVNAGSLFSNLEDLDRLKDDFSHLTVTQREEISRRFGMAFSGGSKLQDEFRTVWNILGEVYVHFKNKLLSRGEAYQGMQMRDVAENSSLDAGGRRFVFAGFNVLSRSEEILFQRLKPDALFYWDVDKYYLDFEAGRFIRENIAKFGSALNVQPDSCFLNSEKEITFIASPSESGQTGVIPEWLDASVDDAGRTSPDSAIVLCNESLLPVVMHAVSPGKIENVNITMGFPMMQTPVAGFLHVLSEMQTKGGGQSGSFYCKFVLPVLRHPYAALLFPEAAVIAKRIADENFFYPDINVLKNELLFTYTPDTKSLCRYLLDIIESTGRIIATNGNPDKSSDLYEGLYQESVFRAWQILNRLCGLLQSDEWKLEKTTFLRLLRKLMSVTQVPFHGEPVKGLQIMGLLETRTLDFKNILLLSVNEGFMPAGQSGDNSFIPRFIRQELGLSTVEREDSIYAYYFYRLLQRAEKITLVYNTDRTQTGKSEMSRFMLQLLIDKRIKIRRFQLQSPVKPAEKQPVLIPKTAGLISQIKELYDLNTNPYAKPVSPSSLNIFIDCPLRFYYLKIKGYKVDEEMLEEMDASVFGTIFHYAAELLYNSLAERYGRNPDSSFRIEKAYLEDFLESGAEIRIEKFVSVSFTKLFFNNRPVSRSQYNGEQLINFRVICRMIKRLIEFDRRRAPFTILGLEWKNYDDYTLPDTGIKIRIGGIIDRLEETDGKIMIIDYKTGSTGKAFNTLDELITENDRRASHIFQTFVYASTLIRQNRFNKPVVPALIYLQEAGKDNYSPVIQYEEQPIEDFRTLYPDFEPLFIQKVGELFNPDIPFRQTSVESNCKYCEFRELCGKP
jgi:CRISPR/Cas system-associated exonuclease Cas4 (RecB family)